jgi:hypothetical protein
MRIVVKALGVFGLWLGAINSGAVASGAAAGPAGAALPLVECRLEHPLHISSQAARCGVLSVPLDRADPKRPKIELHRRTSCRAQPAQYRAPLFLLAGGPGQSAIDLYASLAGAFARINRNHDIVMVDQRGTGRSAPLRCEYADDWAQPATICRRSGRRRSTVSRSSARRAQLYEQRRGPRPG